MTEDSRNLCELLIKAVGPLLVLAGLVFGVIQFQLTAERDRSARDEQYKHTIEEAKREAKKPFYEQQLALYLEATNVTARISTPLSDDDRQAAMARFWQLYWGPLALVESQDVAKAMVAFKNVLVDPGLTGADRKIRLQDASINLAHQCRDSLVKSWDVDLPRLGGG
jgi:hypothetical protein